MKNLAVSIRARLLNLSQKRGESLDRLVEHYAMGRFLYRLSKSSHRERFILKGAQLFHVWGASGHRPTRDLDLLGFGDSSEEAIAAIFTELIQAPTDPEDGLVWGEIRTSAIRDDVTYGGTRAIIPARLAGARLSLQIDIGFGDAITPKPREEEWRELLDFPAARLLVYPPETVIAEKLEALVSLGLRNSRMKDFYDLHWLASHFDLDPVTVRMAVENTFARRGTALPTNPPVAYTTAFAEDRQKREQWNAFLRKNKLPAPELPEIIKVIQAHFPFPL